METRIFKLCKYVSLEHRKGLRESLTDKDLEVFVNLPFVLNRGFVMFDKNKCTRAFLVYTNLFTHCDQVQNTAELCNLLQTIICP